MIAGMCYEKVLRESVEESVHFDAHFLRNRIQIYIEMLMCQMQSLASLTQLSKLECRDTVPWDCETCARHMYQSISQRNKNVLSNGNETHNP